MSEADRKSTSTRPIYRNGDIQDPAIDRSRPVYGGAVDGLPVAATSHVQTASAPTVVDGEDPLTEEALDPSLERAAARNDTEGAEFQGGVENTPSQSTHHLDLEVQAASSDESGLAISAVPESTHPELSDAEVALTTALESLLFVAGEPVEASQFAKSMGLPLAEVERGLVLLTAQFKQTGRGLRLQVLNGKYQLVTAPAAATHVENFLSLDMNSRLSSAALETLAVVAYRQPVTRAQIEAVRGVDCAAVLRSLSHRGLIEAAGRLDAVGRPIVYGVTDLFMQHFGLMELDELPPLEKEDADQLWAATALAEADDIESQ